MNETLLQGRGALLAVPILMISAGCGHSSDTDVDANNIEADQVRPELACKSLSMSTPDYDAGATGAESAAEAVDAYVKPGNATQVFEDSSSVATVFVMDDEEAVAEVRVQDHGDGWVIEHATACAS